MYVSVLHDLIQCVVATWHSCMFNIIAGFSCRRHTFLLMLWFLMLNTRLGITVRHRTAASVSASPIVHLIWQRTACRDCMKDWLCWAKVLCRVRFISISLPLFFVSFCFYVSLFLALFSVLSFFFHSHLLFSSAVAVVVAVVSSSSISLFDCALECFVLVGHCFGCCFCCASDFHFVSFV